MFTAQEESDVRRFLNMLREMGVTQYEGLLPLTSVPVRLVLGAPPKVDMAHEGAMERQAARPQRSLEERLMNPLGITDKTRSTAL